MGQEREKHLKSILFVDLDHTVMQGSFSYAVWTVACGKIAQASGLAIDEVRSLVAQENRRRMQDPSVPAIEAMDWDDVVETVAKKLGVKLETSVLEWVKSHATAPHIKELDRSRQVLTRLRKPKHRAIVAATNGLSKYQMPVLEALGLQDCFADVLSPDRHGVLKDDKRFYGKWPYEAPLRIVVGDNYQYDVRASLDHGFEAIWYLDGKDSWEETSEPLDNSAEVPGRPDVSSVFRIRSLRALPRIIWWLELRAGWRHRLGLDRQAPSRRIPGLGETLRQGLAIFREAVLYSFAWLWEAGTSIQAALKPEPASSNERRDILTEPSVQR